FGSGYRGSSLNIMRNLVKAPQQKAEQNRVPLECWFLCGVRKDRECGQFPT
ncbi:fructosamine 3 kinase related protein, partial [Homo sapiens]